MPLPNDTVVRTNTSFSNVTGYKAKLSVEEDEDTPGRSEVHWDAIFDANGASEEDAEKKIADIFEDGVAGIKKAALTAYDAKHLMSRKRQVIDQIGSEPS